MPFRVLCKNESGKWEEVGLVVDEVPPPRVGETFFLGRFKNSYKVLHVYRGWRLANSSTEGGKAPNYMREHIPYVYVERTTHPEDEE